MSLNKILRALPLRPRQNALCKCKMSTKAENRVPGYKAMSIFDRNSKKLQKERASIREDYHLYEYLKEEIGWRMADRIFDIKRTFKNALELGCSRGYISRHLTPDSVEHITLCDQSEILLDKAQVGDGVKFTKLLMDEECLDLPECTFDLIVSSLSLHWVNDLPGCCAKIMKALKPDGVFMASVFGGDTIYELRQALQLAESERLGGMFQHISPFTRIRDIGGILTSCGFTMQTVDTDEMTIWYPSPWHVMDDIRRMGESNASMDRSPHLRRDVQIAMAAIYTEMYGKEVPDKTEHGVPATYQIINFLGWKPDPSQPKPLQRGSGSVSLKDLHRLDELVKDTKKIEIDEKDTK